MNLTAKLEISEHVLHAVSQNIQDKYDILYKNNDSAQVLSTGILAKIGFVSGEATVVHLKLYDGTIKKIKLATITSIRDG